MFRRMLIALCLLSLASSVYAQSRFEVVKQARADLIAAGVDVDSNDCAGFRITVLAAWRLRHTGAGLLLKPTGNNCALEGNLYARDILVYKTPSGTQTYDVVGGGPEGLNSPIDADPLCCVEESRWHVPVDPGFDPVTPDPPPATSDEALARIASLETQAQDLRGIYNQLRDAYTAMADSFNQLSNLVQAIQALANDTSERVSRLESRIIPMSCSASVIRIPIHCELR